MAKMIIIKRYKNRKLYNTINHSYMNHDDIQKLVDNGDEFMVIDNMTNRDITSQTLVLLIFQNEINNKTHAPLDILKEIVSNGPGTMSNYLQKLGAFSFNNVNGL